MSFTLKSIFFLPSKDPTSHPNLACLPRHLIILQMLPTQQLCQFILLRPQHSPCPPANAVCGCVIENPSKYPISLLKIPCCPQNLLCTLKISYVGPTKSYSSVFPKILFLQLPIFYWRTGMDDIKQIFVGISWIMEGVHRIFGVHRIWRGYVRYLG